LRKTEKKPKNINKEKAPNANLSLGCRVDLYRQGNKQKKKQGQGRRWFQNLFAQTPKKRKQRSRDGRLVDQYRSTSGVLRPFHQEPTQKQQTKKS